MEIAAGDHGEPRVVRDLPRSVVDDEDQRAVALVQAEDPTVQARADVIERLRRAEQLIHGAERVREQVALEAELAEVVSVAASLRPGVDAS